MKDSLIVMAEEYGKKLSSLVDLISWDCAKHNCGVTVSFYTENVRIRVSYLIGGAVLEKVLFLPIEEFYNRPILHSRIKVSAKLSAFYKKCYQTRKFFMKKIHDEILFEKYED